ncbi:MAG: Uma2 family endonuclease [Gemmatimonadaceae bacterium]
MAAVTKQWTLEELNSLPDDGNKYELVRGELFVTPAPTDPHETIGARLSHLLIPYVEREKLGLVYRPQAVMRFEGSEVSPDLMVRQPNPNAEPTWDNAPTPILVVEILSPSTRRRDNVQKRSLYLDAGVAEYGLVDEEQRTITSVRLGHDDVVARTELVWSPPGASAPLTLEVARVFG